MSIFSTLLMSAIYIFNSQGQYLSIGDDGTTSLSSTPVSINLTPVDESDYQTGRYNANANSIDWIIKPSADGTYTIGYNVPDAYATAFLYTPTQANGNTTAHGIALTYMEPSADFTAGQWTISTQDPTCIDVTLNENVAYQKPTFTDKTETANVTLIRTLYAKEWNTFCVPFPITTEQISSIWGEGTRVAKFTRVNGSEIIFSTCQEDGIQANVPYIIEPQQVNKNNTYQIDGVNISDWADTNPKTTIESTDGTYDFIGSYISMTVKAGCYGLASNNVMLHLTKPAPLKGYRAYFTYTSNNGSAAKQLTWGFGDPSTDITVIPGTETTSPTPRDIYQMDGKLVKHKATSTEGLRPGVYIMNGMKVIVK